MMRMNWFDVPEAVAQRVIARSGVAHPHADLDPRRTALSWSICRMPSWTMRSATRSVRWRATSCRNVNRLASVVRGAGGGVFWIKNTFDERGALRMEQFACDADAAMRERRVAAMSEGSKGQELWPELDVRPEDEIVRKYRFSAFMPGTCDLPYRLRARGFDTVLITGTVTNVCCESSARDAMMTNFKTVMVSDANAAMTMEEHNASLVAFYAIFGDVMDTDS